MLQTNELEKFLEKRGEFFQGNRLPPFWLSVEVHRHQQMINSDAANSSALLSRAGGLTA